MHHFDHFDLIRVEHQHRVDLATRHGHHVPRPRAGRPHVSRFRHRTSARSVDPVQEPT